MNTYKYFLSQKNYPIPTSYDINVDFFNDDKDWKHFKEFRQSFYYDVFETLEKTESDFRKFQISKNSKVMNDSKYDALHSCKNMDCAFKAIDFNFLDTRSQNSYAIDNQAEYEEWWNEFKPVLDLLDGTSLTQYDHSKFVYNETNHGIDQDFIDALNKKAENSEIGEKIITKDETTG